MQASTQAAPVHEEGDFTAADGVRLFEQAWLPASGSRGGLVVMHGLRDHGSRYGELAAALATKGLSTFAFDLRGHGRSGGPRVYVDRFDQYVDDLAGFLERVRPRANGPLFLLGHSMGGAIATRCVLTRKPSLKGLLLSAPALKPGAEVSKFLIGVTRVLGSVLPKLPVLKLDPKGFSRDPEVVLENQTDPLIHQPPGAARTAKELLQTLVWLEANGAALELPVLLLHGTADRVTNPDGSRELHAKARATDKTLALQEGLFHDLLHEPEKAKVIAQIVDWISARVG
jgi:alpha-beta hydrolase superfamily lysophospholipase